MLPATLALVLTAFAADAPLQMPEAEWAGVPPLPGLTLRGPLGGGLEGRSTGQQQPPSRVATRSGPAGGAFGSDPAARITLACALGALFPGLGHLASGTYLYRGAAFTAAFLVSMFGAMAFIAADAEGLGGPHAVTGGVLLSVGTAVVYVWSLVDALTLAAEPVGSGRHHF